jgi:adenylate kinase
METKKERKQKKGTLVFPELGNQNEEKFLEELISCLLKKVKSGKHQVKVAEALKAIELKQKMRSKNQRKSKEKIFWELIDQIRKEELPE